MFADGVPDAAKHDAEKEVSATEDEFGAKDYRSQMILKPDHAARPLWVVGHIWYLESCLYHLVKHCTPLLCLD